MSVVSLVILLVSVVYELEEEEEEGEGDAAVVLDTGGALVMVEGATVHVLDLQDVAVPPLVAAVTAGLLLRTVPVKRWLMPMEMVPESDAAAGVDVDTF